MKNSVLHDFIDNLNIETPAMPLHQQQIRRAILNHAVQESRFAHFRHRFTRRNDGLAKRSTKLVGFGTVAMVMLLATFGTAVYGYRYSPKAVAEQTIDQSMMALSTQTPDKLAALQAKFGGDPTAALKEAKQAKDVKVITKDEFMAESRSAPGIFATSLGSANGAVGINNPSGISFMSTKGENGSGTAAISSGAVAVSGGSGMAAGGGTISASFDGSTPTIVTGTDGNMPMPAGAQTVKVNADGTTTVSGMAEAGTSVSSVPSSSGRTEAGVAAIGATTAAGPNGPVFTQAMPAGAMATTVNAQAGDLAQPVTITDAAATYLQYTDSKGHVVVLSLDKNGLPIFKTIFMTKAEASQLKPF